MFNQVLCVPKPLFNNLFPPPSQKAAGTFLAPPPLSSSHLSAPCPPPSSLLQSDLRLLTHHRHRAVLFKLVVSRPERKYQRLPSRCRREPRFRSFLRADGDRRGTGRECSTPGAGPTFRRRRWWRKTTPQERRRRLAHGVDFVMDLGACDELLRKTVAFVALPTAPQHSGAKQRVLGLFAECRSV